MKYDRDAIKARYSNGERLKYVFFWGHTETGGQVTKGCFSQWYPSVFTADGVTYRTAEQYMMARKALLFDDREMLGEIMAAKHPKQCKTLGQQVRGFDQAVWDRHKYQIVLEGNLAKFGQNKPLLDFLLGTGTRVLVEASPYDKIWGIGLPADDPRTENPHQWRGQNLLGFALMEARDQLREIMKKEMSI